MTIRDPAEQLADKLLAARRGRWKGKKADRLVLWSLTADPGEQQIKDWWTRRELLTAIRRHYSMCPQCGYPLSLEDERRMRSMIDKHAKPPKRRRKKK